MLSNSRLHSIYTFLEPWLQLFLNNRKRDIHHMGGCNWDCELTQYLSNTCQIHCIYAIHGCKCHFKKNPIHLGMDGYSYVCEIKKHSTQKKLFPVTKRSNFFFRNNYFESQPFLMSCYFTRIFVHLPVNVAVCYFNVHKLIGWDSTNIYLF